MRGIWLIPALVAVVAVYAAIDDGAGFRSLYRLHGDLHSARERIDALRGDIAHLTREAEELQTQTFASERAIREELELTRRGEILVRLPRAAEPESE